MSATEARTAGEIYWDPYDIELDSNPYPMWKRMRDEAPLYRNDRYDFWALSRFADVEAASKDPGTYSSAEGTVLEQMGDHMRNANLMIFMDPPEHTKLRALVSRAFTPRRISALEPRIREICAELLDPHVGSSGFDFLQDFGAILPSRVISDLVGVPPEEQEAKRHVIDELFHIEPGVGMVNDTSVNASFTLISYLVELLEDREEHPRDDMLTALVQAEITEDDGSIRRLTIPEAASFGMLLYTAGTETVARLLGNAAIELAANPDQRADLVANPDIAGNAVEELLRYEAPSPVQGRTITREVEWHGEKLQPGSRILLLTGSAGRDERAFPDPDRFDIRREMQHHVSFGYGIHFCVGAALARMEGRVALQEVTKRFPEWEVDHANARRLHTSTVRGWAEVPVKV